MKIRFNPLERSAPDFGNLINKMTVMNQKKIELRTVKQFQCNTDRICSSFNNSERLWMYMLRNQEIGSFEFMMSEIKSFFLKKLIKDLNLI